MKAKRFFLFAVMAVSTAAILTSCEDILGQWDRPSGAVTSSTSESPGGEEDDADGCSFRLQNLTHANITATTFKVTDQTGAVVATVVSNGRYAISESDLGSVTTLWFEATTASGRYVAKAKVEDIAAIYKVGKLAMATLGDLMAADGLFYADAAAVSAAGTEAVGVIGYLGNDSFTENGTTVGDSPFVGHGLLLCLKNAASGSDARWSSVTSAYEFDEEAKVTAVADMKRTTNVSGYTNTKTLAEKTDAANKYKAAYAARNFTGLTAPAGTTGWFLPSAQQWVKLLEGLGGLSDGAPSFDEDFFDHDLTAATNWEKALEKAGSGNYDSMNHEDNITDLRYWSSSESTAGEAVYLTVKPENPYAPGDHNYDGFYWEVWNKDDQGVSKRSRPFLAF